MEHTPELIPRILRDIGDSVLALDGRGHIIYMNPQCQSLLGLNSSALDQTYADVFFHEEKTENDCFHQFVLDAIYNKEEKHCGTVSYTDKNNKRMYLRITSSFLQGEGANESCGVVLVVSDVTDAEILRKKKHDASIVFFCVTACVCLYLVLVAALDFFAIYVPTKTLTQVINGMVFAFCAIIYKKTAFSFEELGLKIRNLRTTLFSSVGVAGLLVILLMTVKVVVYKIFPDFFAEDVPFWNWNIGVYSWVSYIFTCIIQELLARSMVYGSIKKIFEGKHGTLAAIFLSSLLFGAVHIAHGFMYMMAAMILLGSLGGLYEKHRNIWGVTMIHFVLGQSACCLGFLA